MTKAEKFETSMANNEAIAKNVPKVYEAGKVHGYSEGVDSGEQSERDRFWRVYTGNTGFGKDWRRKFANPGWTDELFDPPFTKIVATQYAGGMFQTSGIKDGLKKLTEIDISATNTASSGMGSFASSTLCTYFPVMKMPPNCDLNLSFAYNVELIQIEKLCISESNSYTNTFAFSSKLKNIAIDGIIGNTISFEHSPLTKESITNIVDHLSSSVTGRRLTLNKSAKEAAFTDAEWEVLVATKSNWTFNLV